MITLSRVYTYHGQHNYYDMVIQYLQFLQSEQYQNLCLIDEIIALC